MSIGEERKHALPDITAQVQRRPLLLRLCVKWVQRTYAAASDQCPQVFSLLTATCVQVSEAGDVLYVLPSNFKNIIRGRSWMLRAMPFLTRVKEAGAYLVRVGFGAALVTSVALVWITILAIMSSGGSDRDDRYAHLP